MTPASSYGLAYAAAWAVAAIGIVAGVIAGIGATVHPAWLTADIQATATILAAVCVAVGAILPQVTRTPAAREQAYLAAVDMNKLPDDLAAKHGQTVPPANAPAVPVNVRDQVAAIESQRDALNAQLEQIAGITRSVAPQPALPASTTPSVPAPQT